MTSDTRIAEAVRRHLRDPYGPLPPHSHDDRVAAIVAHSLNSDSIRQRASRSDTLSHARARARRRLIFASAVSALAIVVGASSWMYKHAQQPAPESYHYVAQSYRTLPGQRGLVTLPDGSQVVLGPATALTITGARASDLDVTARTAVVQGEAYFTVTGTSSAPFSVTTENAVAHVLGTQFLVRRYAGEGETRVVVADGRVALGASDTPSDTRSQVVLSAGQMGVVADSGTVITTSTTDIADYADWKAGKLTFERTPARIVAAELGRAYDLSLQIADSVLANRLVTWEIETRQYPAADVLDEFVTLLGARLERAGSVITLVPGRRITRQAPPARTLLPLETRYGR